MTAWLARLLGYRDLASIDQISPSLVAPWAHAHPLLVLLGCLVLMALVALFYARMQPERRPLARVALATARAIVICVLLLSLAEPTLVVKLVRHPRPLVWLLFDGTDSMAIEDDVSDEEHSRLAAAIGLPRADDAPKPTRQACVQSMIKDQDGEWFERLNEKFRLRAFRFDRSDGVTALDLETAEGEPPSAEDLAEQLTTRGQVTALTAALTDLERRHARSSVAGLVVFSDFDQNSGSSPLAAARSLDVPLYTVGVGPAAAVYLTIDLQTPLPPKKGERTTLNVVVKQNGLDGQAVNVRLLAKSLDMSDQGESVIDQRRVTLDRPQVPLEFDFTPAETGRVLLSAVVEPVAGEIPRQNNRSEREVIVRDDFLRLMFAEYEPTWEWRFIKEVFHRDRLVGMRGFRTYLRSADPKVRQTNELFLGTMTPPRSDFFANDVIFLGDLPASALTPRFCEMTKEFVSKFGGGLVIVSGPNFGPGQLGATPLADLLPVVVDPEARPRDAREFVPRLTPHAAHVDFMHLGASAGENAKAWSNLGRLEWYQPVSRVHPLATVLLEHPQDTCVDGRTRQPIVALRRYGRGEVVYLAMNETWRLRRKYGEAYYRQFWGQMIYRLGLSHALGTQKRFVVRTDDDRYQTDDKVTLSVEAYDENFEPLEAEKLTDHKLWAELVVPGQDSGKPTGTAHPLNDDKARHEAIPIPETREGLFETQIPVYAAGEHRIRVKDPITKEIVEVDFQVTSVSAERRSVVRNQALAEQLAAETGGHNYDLLTADHIPDDIKPRGAKETLVEVVPLWSTWGAFFVVVSLLLAEWLGRKLMSLA